MIVNIAHSVVRTLELNEEESKYLANLTQNYLGSGEESSKDAKIRQAIFNSVTRDIPGEVEYK